MAAILLALVLGVTALYAHASWSAVWIYDDVEVILNQEAPASLADVAQYFGERHFPGLAYYRPVTRTTLLVQWALHGDDTRPFHVFNGALAGLLLVAAWGALRRLGAGRWSALAAATLMALHPAASSCVYPVASGRETMQPAVFALATLWASLRGGRRWTALTVLLFTGALFGKEQMVVLPALLLLADVLGLGAQEDGSPRQGLASVRAAGRGAGGALAAWGRAAARWMDRERWLRYGALAAVTVSYFLLRQRLFGGDELRLAVLEQPLGPVVSLLYSLQTLFLPFLDLHYEPPFAVWWNPLGALVALALAMLLVVAAWRAGVSRRLLVFAGAWFVLAQLATANVIYQEAKFSERYVLLAYFGAAVVASRWGTEAFVTRRQQLRAGAVAVLLILVAGAVSYHRAQFFRDPFAFHAQWAASNPFTEIPRMGLGLDYAERGEPERAELAFREALELKPEYVDGHFNFGNFLADEGRYEEAAASYREVLEQAPDRLQARINLADALRLGGRYDEALVAYDEALGDLERSASDDVRRAALEARRAEAEALASGPEAGDVDSWRQAVAAAPTDAGLRLRYGNALADEGRREEALEQYRRAVALDPERAQAHYNLGTTLLSTGAVELARAALERAVALVPTSADARTNLASALAASGRLPEALEQFARAVELAPESASARFGYGTALLATGQPAAAAAQLAAGLEALDASETAAEAAVGRAPALLLLGQARAAVGDRAGAREALEQALELDSELTLARQLLEQLDG